MRGARCGWAPSAAATSIAAIADPPDAAEQHGAQRDHVGNVRQDAVGEQRHGFGGLVGAEAELLEGNAGEKQHGSAAHFVEAVDVIDVIAGIVP